MLIMDSLLEKALSKKIAEAIVTIILIFFVGWVLAAIWLVFGIIFSVTIIGLPLGKRCFKISAYAFNSKKKVVSYEKDKRKLLHFLWFPIGLVLFIITFVIVGFISPFIIFAPSIKRYYKLLKMCFVPFNTVIEKTF